MAGQTQTIATQLSIGGKEFCFVKIDDASNFSLTDASERNNCGTAYHHKEDVDDGPRIPRLHMLLQPSPEEIDELLPWFGLTESTDVWTPLESDFSGAALTPDIVIDRKAKVHTYTDCHVDKVILRGAKGQHPLSIEIQCVAEGFSEGNAGSFSATAISNKTAPYAFHRGALTLAGTAYGFNTFTWIMDYHLNVEHNNSQYPTAIEIGDITYHLGHSSPYTSTEAGLLSTKISAPQTGIAGSLAFTRGNQAMTLAFHNMKGGAVLPSIPGKPKEVRENHLWQIYGNASNRPFTWTNDVST